MTYVKGKGRRKPVLAPKADGESLTEHEEQVRVVVYLSKTNRLCYAVPNGGKRGMLEAVKLKAEGVSAGVPDLCIPMARKGYHGLYIELKRVRGGAVSEAQAFWHEQLKKEGYAVHVCKGHEAAIKCIEDYFYDSQHLLRG